MIAYSYKRFSSKQQSEGTSIERQTAKVVKYCKDNNLELSGQNFEDLGLSAYHQRNTEEDAGLGQFISGLEQGKVNTPCYLLVESLDRLSRANIKTAMTQLWRITDYDVSVVTLIDGRVYTKDMDFTDFLMAGLVMERANEESRTKADRAISYWDIKRKRLEEGKAQKGRIPFWLQRNEDSYELVQDKVEVVQKVFELRLTGMGSTKVAKHLNSLGLTGATDKWSPATVGKLLKNITVMGLYQPHRMNGKDKEPLGEPLDIYPKIVSREDFYKVQSMIKKIKKGSTKTHRNVFIDLAKCKCGSNFVLNKKNTYFLQCTNNRDGLCDNKLIPLSLLEKFLRQYLLSPQYHNIWVSGAEEVHKQQQKIQGLVAERDTLQKALDGLLSVPEQLANQSVIDRVTSMSLSISQLDEQIQLTDIPRDNRRLSFDQTLQMLNTAFSKEDLPDNIRARTQLRSILQPESFGSFTVTRHNTDSLNDTLELYVEKPLGLTYVSTGIRKARYLDEVWKVHSDKTKNELTEEEKLEFIKQIKS